MKLNWTRYGKDTKSTFRDNKATAANTSGTKDGKETPQHQKHQAKDKVTALIEAIEEDDDFEEFQPCNWNKDSEHVEDLQQWQENWDDDDIEDDFTKNLRAELTASATQN